MRIDKEKYVSHIKDYNKIIDMRRIIDEIGLVLRDRDT